MKRNGLVVPLRVVWFGKVRRCGVEGVHEQGVVRGGVRMFALQVRDISVAV